MYEVQRLGVGQSPRVPRSEPPAGPNGSCLLAPGVMLFADCVEGLIWRVDLSDDGLHATARVWLKHDTMAAGAGHPPVKFSATMEARSQPNPTTPASNTHWPT